MAPLQPRDSGAASSFFRAPPPPTCVYRARFNPSRVLMPVDAARDGKRRHCCGGEDDDVSRASKKQAVGRVASPVAQLSCARIRPFVRASRPKEESLVTARAVEVITKQKTSDSVSCKKFEPAVQASRPKKETSSSTQASTRTLAQGVITKQKPGENISCTRIRPAVAVQPSGLKNTTKDRNDGVIKTKQEAGERPTLSHPASAMKVRSASVLRNKARGLIKTKQEASRRVQATVTKSVPQVRPPAPVKNHQDPRAPQDAMRAALAAARQARDRRQQNIYRQEREEARRELDKVVRTVFFDDPYITVADVFKP